MTGRYAFAPGGLPGQDERVGSRAVFTGIYAFLPARVMSDIVTSRFPGWEKTRGWIIARPLSGFAETFAHCLIEIAPGGGSDTPEPDPGAEGAIFVAEGGLALTIGGTLHDLGPGGFAYLPPGAEWRVAAQDGARFHWLRKAWEPAAGLEAPDQIVVADERAVAPVPMPGTEGRWATTRFVDPDDLRHDMHVTIVTIQPGASIPFAETHVMEHGLYVLEGRGMYLLNRDWVEVEAGDYMWLRAFCPQAAYATGTGPFRYLLYKDVNRHPKLRPFGR
jgi:(S)-ureidoglycine aminohydrolase